MSSTMEDDDDDDDADLNEAVDAPAAPDDQCVSSPAVEVSLTPAGGWEHAASKGGVQVSSSESIA